jgi:uncharacterized protein YxeA
VIEAIAAVLVAVIGAFFWGRRSAKNSQIVKEAKDYQKTMESMHEDAAIVNDDYAREWLRDRKP